MSALSLHIESTDSMMTSIEVELVMSLQVMSLGLRFCASRKGRTGGGGAPKG